MATAASTICAHMDGRLAYLVQRGFEVTVVCAAAGGLADRIRRYGVRLHEAPLTRTITPLPDLLCLWHLWRYFRRERFDLIEYGTPKAALLGSIAAWLAGIPARIFLLHGLFHLVPGRASRLFRRTMTLIPARLSHRLLAVAPSIAERAVEEGLAPRERIAALGKGSVNGVDLEQCRPGRGDLRSAVRAKHKIPADAIVVGFVARLRGEKGMVELVDAFAALRDRYPRLHLLIVGDYDIEDRPPERIVNLLARDPRVACTGWQDDPTPFYAAMDIYCMPTYRDGFGVVFIEAAATGVPSVGTDIIGARDAIEPGISGLRVPPRDTQAVQAALESLIADDDLRRRMGASARQWAEEHFDRRNHWRLYEAEYRRLLEASAAR